MSAQQPSAWGGPPTPHQTQPVVNRQCRHSGWPTPAADPVCRNCGYIARQQIAQHQGMQQGRGRATAGIVLGWIRVGFLVLFVLVAILGMASSPAYHALRLLPS